MGMAGENAPDRLGKYLRKVRSNLHGMPASEADEVVRELRSHVLDRVGGDLNEINIGDALARLGEPEEVARINLSMRIAARAAGRTSQVVVTQTIVQLARLSIRGFFTLLLSAVGYAFAASWILTAIAKPFAPERVGLWLLPDPTGDLSFSLGRSASPVVGQDVLGWWIIPIGLAVGLAVAFLTYRLDLRAIRRLAELKNRWSE
jgi:hypothetical protein